ncbi:unnamed protein product [Cuscuta epithymum]|uniref:Uncharacterized protein n=1 Tax=Cuscuta epithymum TaxID=186058 RepID=A0AAV0E3M8_9ASTE|nr:unnamed protein product [Cuscuta epithymum]
MEILDYTHQLDSINTQGKIVDWSATLEIQEEFVYVKHYPHNWWKPTIYAKCSCNQMTLCSFCKIWLYFLAKMFHQKSINMKINITFIKMNDNQGIMFGIGSAIIRKF